MQHFSRNLVHDDVISQLYYISANGIADDLANRKLAFDPSAYSRKKLVRFPRWARHIAEKIPQDRSTDDVKALCRLLNSMRSFRDKFSQEIKLKICRVARYSNYEKGRVVVRQGQKGHNFYFIYSGSVFVQKESVDPLTRRKRLATENIIDQGACFGELALMADEGKRTATVICREPTELFQIERDTFEEIEPIADIFRKELEHKVQVAMQYPIFQKWPESKVQQLCFQSHVKSIPHGKLIEKDWSAASHIYFVIRGSILLMREFSVPQTEQDSREVTLEGMMGRPLPPPRCCSRLVRHATVGQLQAGQHSDARILLEEKESVPNVIMVSQGADVLRMSVSMVKAIAPRGTLSEYIKSRYTPLIIPKQSELYIQFLQEYSWDEFKYKVYRSVLLSRKGRPVAVLPATAKGSSGWARWPGVKLSPSPRSRASTSISCKSHFSLPEQRKTGIVLCTPSVPSEGSSINPLSILRSSRARHNSNQTPRPSRKLQLRFEGR